MQILLLVLSLAGIVSPLFGELPPSAYLQFQNGAPTQVTIKVDAVKQQHWFRKKESVSATVTTVTKSATKLKVGDKIMIKYRHMSLSKWSGRSCSNSKAEEGRGLFGLAEENRGGIFRTRCAWEEFLESA